MSRSPRGSGGIRGFGGTRVSGGTASGGQPSDDVLVGLAVVVLVVISQLLGGWPGLVLIILAAGGAFGLVAGAAYDGPGAPAAPAPRSMGGRGHRAA